MAGVLDGLRVIELAGLGPCPLAGQLLADLGAEVILVERRAGGPRPTDVNNRSKRSIVLNLKDGEAVEAVLRLAGKSHILIEGFRPGVTERLGLGPDACMARNPALVYGRMTGWGQDGPLAQTAGHDLNYLALTGALFMMGKKGEPPLPPLNLVADYGGGTMFLLFGVLSALWNAGRTGQGQVVDAAMMEGVPAMMGIFHQLRAAHDGGSLFPAAWTPQRQSNLLDGGAPFYRCYACADGGFVSVGPLEPQFFALLIEGLELGEEWRARQYDRSQWPAMEAVFAERFASRSRDAWAEHFAGSDACVMPVLTPEEAPAHPHNKARNVFGELAGVTQPMPAPAFSHTPSPAPRPPQPAGTSTKEILALAGYGEGEIEAMLTAGIASGAKG